MQYAGILAFIMAFLVFLERIGVFDGFKERQAEKRYKKEQEGLDQLRGKAHLPSKVYDHQWPED